MKVAILSPVAWRTPPERYGPWEQVASNITEGLVENKIDVTLFATGNSVTADKLEWCCKIPYGDDPDADAKVIEALHISYLFERASEFDIIHNHYDFLPLCFATLVDTPVVTTIHGFSSPSIIPVYKKYNRGNYYVSISDANRNDALDYMATVYNGINIADFSFCDEPDDYLLFFGRIHPDKGTREAIEIARLSEKKLIIAGLIQDQEYFKRWVLPHIDDVKVIFAGNCAPEERNQLLGRARALLHPISFNEPFGLSVVEAQCCGTPVIAFNKGAMPELIQQRSNGFLVDNIEQSVQAVEQISIINRTHCRTSVISKF
ncbi:MAG: glycosyltransferase family 4 protein [Agriterribacter sp.]